MDDFSNFQAQFEQSVSLATGAGGGWQKDPAQFKPSVEEGKRTSYTAVVRFIPPTEGPMFVKKIVHFMKFGGRTNRFICPKSLDPRAYCPICEQNIADNKSNIKDLKDRAQKNGNKVRWVANVLILNDEVNPSDNGKVMWWEFPDQIMGMINAAKNSTNPIFPAINAFHPIEGASFYLSMSIIDKIPKYDGSQFIRPAAPLGDIDYIRQVRALCHDIQSQIVIPTEAELSEALAKTNGSGPRNFASFENAGTPAPNVGGFSRFVPPAPPVAQASAVAPDEFELAFQQAGQQAPVANYAAPAPVTAPQAPKPALQVPRAPVQLQTPASVMPAPAARVTPIPPTPAVPQPHPDSVHVENEEWLN